MNIIIRLLVTAFIAILRMVYRKKKQRQEQRAPCIEPSPMIFKTSLPARLWNKICRKKSVLPPPIPGAKSELFTESSPVSDVVATHSIAPPPIPQAAENNQANKPIQKTLLDKIQFKKLLASAKSLMGLLDAEKQKKVFFESYRFVSHHLSSLQKPSATRDVVILRPGQPSEAWELWKITSSKSKENSTIESSIPVLIDAHAAPFLSSNKTRLIVGVPTRDLTVIPLWISSEGNLQELVELELASKHLLRRGMAEGLKTIPVETKDGRTLVSVLAPASTLSAITAPYLKQADQFEAAARLLPHDGKDLLIWQELSEICFGFFKNGECVWFSGSGETLVNRRLLGLITRMSWQLQAESVIADLPKTLRVIGSFSAEEMELLQNFLKTENNCEHLTEFLPPLLPTPALDLPPQEARLERMEAEKKQRIKKIVAVAFAIYFLLLLLGTINVIIKESILKRLEYQVAAEKTPIEKANHNIQRWEEFRSAIDPNSYALDLLTTIATQIHGEKIRLITFAKADGHLQISGEATDVAQAYHFIELIKKAPELQEYQWTSGQPKLAGKNSVRFEIEGSQAHAKKIEE